MDATVADCVVDDLDVVITAEASARLAGRLDDARNLEVAQRRHEAGADIKHAPACADSIYAALAEVDAHPPRSD